MAERPDLGREHQKLIDEHRVGRQYYYYFLKFILLVV